MQHDPPDFLLHLLCNHFVVTIRSHRAICIFSKLWENVDHLLQAAFFQKCISAGKHPAGSCCYEGWSLLLNYCAFLVQKAQKTPPPKISEEVYRQKPGNFPGIQPGCFYPSSTRVFSCLINFWDSPRTTYSAWCCGWRGLKCALNCRSSPLAKVMATRGEQHKALQQPSWHLQGRRRARLCPWWAMMPSRANSHHHLIKAAHSPKQVLYSGKSCCFDLYGNWKLMLISSSFLVCLKVSKWWNICIYIREDTAMALLRVHPCILLHIAGDRFEREKWVCCHFSYVISQNTLQILIDSIISKCPQTWVVLWAHKTKSLFSAAEFKKILFVSDKLVYSYILERQTKDWQCSEERKFIRKLRYYLDSACYLIFLFLLFPQAWWMPVEVKEF